MSDFLLAQHAWMLSPFPAQMRDALANVREARQLRLR